MNVKNRKLQRENCDGKMRFYSKINVDKIIFIHHFPLAYGIVLSAEGKIMFAKKKFFLSIIILFLDSTL